MDETNLKLIRARKVIGDLLKACHTLMDEVTGSKATKWQIVNEALVEGEKYLLEKGR